LNIWLPYIAGGSGTDVFTETLAKALAHRGHAATAQRFAHNWQYAPWMLRTVQPPGETQIVLANTWNAFTFRRKGIPLVAVEHLFVLDPALAPYKSFAQRRFHNTLVRHFEHATSGNAAQIVAVSHYTARAYQRVFSGKPTAVILNGIDTDFFTPAPSGKAALADRPFRLLFVGNMSRRKGADMIPAILGLLGNGFEVSYTAGLRAQDPFPGLAGARKLGMLDHAGVRDEYRRADALLFPTRLEGLPLVAMEAMACGTPVIASDTASLPEVVSHEQSGMLCSLDDAGSFARAIDRLRADPDLLAQLGANAREVAVARFSIHRMVDDYLGLFSELLA
jgi:glycosyltransferase involved in cell wall biosynthesis